MKVVVTGRIPAPGMAVLREVVDGEGEVWVWEGDTPLPTDIRDRQLADAEIVVTLVHDRVDDMFLQAAPRLRMIANVAVGFNNIDVDACSARGVQVSNTPGVLTAATADLAMALLLMTTRRLGEGERLVRSGTPWRWNMFMMLGSGLQGRRLGIVGMGAIGTALAERARAFGLEIVYCNRRRVSPTVENRLQAIRLDLDDLLATSDVVSLHCPATPETHHIIDRQALETMKPTGHVVNTARGSVVDEAALVDALQTGSIAGAALDVYEYEPKVHPGLLGLENVVLAPHLGSATTETRTAMAVLAAENVRSFVATGELVTPVTTV